MKPYQKIIAVTLIILMVADLIMINLAAEKEHLFFLTVAGFISIPLIILLLVFMFTYRNQTFRRIMLLLMPGSIIIYITGSYLDSLDLFILSIFLLGFSCLVNLIVYFRRYDLNLIVVTFLVIIGLIFKREHLPGGSFIITMASAFLAYFSVVNGIRAFRNRENRYLSVVIFSCYLILALTSIGFVMKMQHFPGAGVALIINTPLFIIATLVILLTLPGSNFLEWTRNQKKILLRGILIPWVFFLYIMAVAAFSEGYKFDVFFFLQTGQKEAPFNMDDYELENRNSLEE